VPHSPAPPTNPVHDTETAELTVRLRQGTLRLARRLRQEADADFGQSLVSALATIDRYGPLTLGELAEREHLAPPSITKLVNRLESEGLVRRGPHPDDGRAVSVTVTRTGAARVARARDRATSWLSARIDDLPAEDATTLADVVKLLEALLAEGGR
jgi:DNA-binding MarR family transcriptional regulator